MLGRPGRPVALIILVLLVFGVLAPLAYADHDDGVYELPSLVMWSSAQLDVLVVPPSHGQIYNFETGILNGSDPDELTPFNSYLKAIEDSIAAWDSAVNLLGADWLEDAYDVKVYVLGRDEIPQGVLTSPDILVTTDEEGGGALGTAIRLTPCVVRVSKLSIISFTYADMYNVMAQEFGHCLGLQHVGSQGGVDPTSDLKHPEHDVMNGFYTHDVGFKGTHLHCISNLDILGLEFAFSLINPALLRTAGGRATSYVPADAYGDTCALPPFDWRSRVPPLLNSEAIGMASQIGSPVAGSAKPATRFRAIKGSATGSDSGRAFTVQVAIARASADGRCDWWDDDSGTFITRDCYSPVWLHTNGNTSWTFRTDHTLPTGTYRAYSRVADTYAHEHCCEMGRNQIEFTLTSTRKRS